MNNLIDYASVKSVLDGLEADDTIAYAHGILCGFACVKPEVSLPEWLAEILPNATAEGSIEQSVSEKLSQIYNNTLLQLSDSTLNFQLLIADENSTLAQQSEALVQWCQGFLAGLGLCKINSTEKEVLEMIKDFSEISQLDTQMPDNEQNSQDLSEIIEFVRMGTLLIQETLQPSKQDFVSPKILH